MNAVILSYTILWTNSQYLTETHLISGRSFPQEIMDILSWLQVPPSKLHRSPPVLGHVLAASSLGGWSLLLPWTSSWGERPPLSCLGGGGPWLGWAEAQAWGGGQMPGDSGGVGAPAGRTLGGSLCHSGLAWDLPEHKPNSSGVVKWVIIVYLMHVLWQKHICCYFQILEINFAVTQFCEFPLLLLKVQTWLCESLWRHENCT